MLSVTLDPDLENRLAALAKRRGQSDSDLARELIESSLEDIEDTQMASQRLETREPALSAADARKALGLDG